MNDDLISRRELLKKLTFTEYGERIREYDCDNFPTTINLCSVKTIIRNMPTVFNKEKMIEELEEYLFEKYCIEGDTKIDEIVEKGGIEW